MLWALALLYRLPSWIMRLEFYNLINFFSSVLRLFFPTATYNNTLVLPWIWYIRLLEHFLRAKENHDGADDDDDEEHWQPLLLWSCGCNYTDDKQTDRRSGSVDPTRPCYVVFWKEVTLNHRLVVDGNRGCDLHRELKLKLTCMLGLQGGGWDRESMNHQHFLFISNCTSI